MKREHGEKLADRRKLKSRVDFLNEEKNCRLDSLWRGRKFRPAAVGWANLFELKPLEKAMSRNAANHEVNGQNAELKTQGRQTLTFQGDLAQTIIQSG